MAAITILALAAVAGGVGADARWLAAIGGRIAAHGSIPDGVPFASAPTAHWPNVLVLAELSFHGLVSAFGDRGLVLAQLLAIAIAVAVLARDARSGRAMPRAVAAALLIGAVAVLPDLAVARVQLFSIALFPVLVALLRSQARSPSRAIWLVVPLLALWSNLHGAALTGFAVTLAYLVLCRARTQPGMALAVAALAVVALCATPAGLHTLAYYHGVLVNRAATRGEGMWAPLSLARPFDLVLIAAAAVLVSRAIRARPAAWELAVLLALALLTIKTSRSGIWLVFFAIPLSACAGESRRRWERVLPAVATIALAILVLSLVRGPVPSGATSRVLGRALAVAHGSPILAEDLFAEQVALGGGRIVVGNPLDAFTPVEQDRYLDWLEGRASGLRELAAGSSVVLTARQGTTFRLMRGSRAFRLVDGDRRTALFLRR